ncbi:hypothetical protein [Listeria costaricensis]|uniref:hypothetical protein n=1 Tax=Listeria costaricensis TaxID=2026604 RepID=UPI001F09B115|nr:hypothetical protein [Listeria costaricensis]
MFIRYDELELMELFLTEEKSITGNPEDGNLLYKRELANFSLALYIYTYEQQIDIFLKYKNKEICCMDLSNITTLKKEGSYLKIYQNEKELAKIHFGSIFTVYVKE